MSQFPGASGGGAPNPAAMPPRRRPASVQLREAPEAGSDLASLMDPATKSLAEALRITYRVLQLGMAALVLVFLFSGVRAVQTNEKGVRLQIGRIESDDLPPGIQFTLPAPFGELVTVPAGLETVKLDGEFWPQLPASEMRKSPDELKNAPRGKLDPATDGSIITADGSLAHARFSVTFRRDQVRDYLSTVSSREAAEGMVRSAVRRGVVHAGASVTIDEFLSDRPDATRREGTYRDIAATIKNVAQKTLDDMGSGIVLQDLSIQDRTPPIDVIQKFQDVSTADARATQQRKLAEEEAAKMLAAAGGQNAEKLLKLIDRYDQALSSKDGDAARDELAKIDALLDGQAVMLDGVEVKGIGGKAAATLANAREYRSSTVSRAQADAALFAVKLESYKKNPAVMVTGEWSEAYRTFLSKNVEVMMLPPGTSTIELLLNTDPSLRRQDAIRRQEQEAARKAKQDAESLENRKFETEKKPQEVSGM
ncbi:MAG: SPFH domain-containing protein [Phycisphaerales bacterium]